MANHLSHFSVCADDPQRAMRFYGQVFGWGFEPYGPPGFYLLHTDGTGKGGRVPGALQQRFEIVPGVMLNGYECTISVPNIDATVAKLEKAGAKILMPKATIPTVGTLVRFKDSEGIVVCAMQYDDPTR